ncbi:FAD-dependent monooxygenase [Bradyrhizobium mercantei]|uniref:FAD-dependent monooxygenase n=1 Tax=Bradyrhizobium mercantei TaxID=1904807 RepID=UPI00097628E1|nr:FAD-dependent monooxygenase [Bradyrhizobium mercantei]
MGDRTIIIVGGGLGGLTAALALLRQGIKVTVLEQAEELRELGAGVQLSPNGTRVLSHLGLDDAMNAVSVAPQAKEIRLWNSGETWPLFDLGATAIAEFGHPYLMFHRGDLQMLLARAVLAASPSAIRLGAKVTDIIDDGQAPTAVLTDGERVSGLALVGADGIHSRVRSALFGDSRPSFTGCVAWRGTVASRSLPDRLSRAVGTNWVGPGRHVVTYPLRCGELINFVGVVERDAWETESWTARGDRADCAADFAGWHEDVHALIENIEVHYRWALMSRPPIKQWSRGNIVLIGDAAHPMLPFMAQGAVMAIEDGMILARCFSHFASDPEKAIASFKAARIERANRCVELADRNRLLFHNERLFDREDAHRYVTSQWNEEKVRERYDWLFRYDAVGCSI